MKEKGFTFLELVLVIALLGIIAVVMLPRLITMSDEGDLRARDAIVAAIRSRIALAHAEQLALGQPAAFPSTLEEAEAPCCFSGILPEPIEGWSRSAANYTHLATMTTFRYESTTGRFVREPTVENFPSVNATTAAPSDGSEQHVRNPIEP